MTLEWFPAEEVIELSEAASVCPGWVALIVAADVSGSHWYSCHVQEDLWQGGSDGCGSVWKIHLSIGSRLLIRWRLELDDFQDIVPLMPIVVVGLELVLLVMPLNLFSTIL